MEEERVTVIVPEKKEKIEKIGQKYNNPNLSTADAIKIQTLEVVNKILSAAAGIAGVAFVIDLIIPDPVIGIDEAALGFITTATTSANVIVQNKINAIANSQDASLKGEEVQKLASQISAALTAVKSNRSSFKK